jgi:hypothetical protein
MNNLSAFIIKLKEPTNPENENDLDRDIFIALKAFTKEEQEKEMILEEYTLIAFICPEDKYKLDGVIAAAENIQSGIIKVYEDVTEKFLYKNDFSHYSTKSDLIDGFIKSRLTKDDVLDKINAIGLENLTEVDYSILKATEATEATETILTSLLSF